MCVGHPAEKLDQIDVMKGFLRPTAGIYRTAGPCCRRGRFGQAGAIKTEVLMIVTPVSQDNPVVSDALPGFRTPAEQTACAAVLADLVGRRWGDEAVMMFREPVDADAAVVAGAMIRAGSVSDALYARRCRSALCSAASYSRGCIRCVRHAGPNRP